MNSELGGGIFEHAPKVAEHSSPECFQFFWPDEAAKTLATSNPGIGSLTWFVTGSENVAYRMEMCQTYRMPSFATSRVVTFHHLFAITQPSEVANPACAYRR